MVDRFSNRNTLWAATIADELAATGLTRACIAPGSRNTPLTVACSDHEAITVYSQLDERSAGFFALGQARATDVPTVLVCTSGTAAANFHPAVIEADQAQVPLVVLTADRPRVLQQSGANQTIDQESLYGSAVRRYRTLPEPAADERKLRALRTAIDRAAFTAMGDDPGPVHLNVPFEKPLEPTPVPDGTETLRESDSVAVVGRSGPYVTIDQGEKSAPASLDRLVSAVRQAERGLIVAGPDSDLTATACETLAAVTGFLVLADPVSGVRFGPHVDTAPVFGGYDGYLDSLPVEPDCVLRVGQSPTSKRLRQYLETADCPQFLIDPAGRWHEATFTATTLVTAEPAAIVDTLATRLDPPAGTDSNWERMFRTAESRHWAAIADDDTHFEGGVVHDLTRLAPDPATLFVSNSMPVRDLDRFGPPRSGRLRAHANRGASGIDGIVSTALGIGSTTTAPLVVLTGDLAFYHDMNGLLAVQRCGVDATIVVLNNDGGGIFNMLPIESFDPPFTELFNTPHGLSFEPVTELYGLEYTLVEDRAAFRDAYRRSIADPGTQVIEVSVDDAASHLHRNLLDERDYSSLDERDD